MDIPRGLQFAVLKAIPVLGSNACGVKLAEKINRNAPKPISPAQVYLALSRLHAKGFLDSKNHKVGGRGHPRKVYALSDQGKKALQASIRFYGG